MAEIETTPPATDDLVFDATKKKKKSKKPVFEGAEDGAGENSVDEVTDLMAEFGKKKKKKEKTGGEDAGEDFEFKKKKKKSSKATDAFDQELEAAGVTEKKEKKEKKTAVQVNADGEPDLTYDELLQRFFKILRENNPDLAGDRSGVKYKIPPPAVQRDGNKKTQFANVKEIADRMHRSMDHIIQFLFAELGTTGSIDGSNRLIIKGRYQQKQIESVLRRYIIEYVTCKTCKSVNTRLTKENRLLFLDCNSCGSRKSVSTIKVGYQAIIRRGRK